MVSCCDLHWFDLLMFVCDCVFVCFVDLMILLFRSCVDLYVPSGLVVWISDLLFSTCFGCVVLFVLFLSSV